jgi:hypothetical protein
LKRFAAAISFLLVALLIAVGAFVATSRDRDDAGKGAVPSGEYTWKEALRLGLVSAKNFERMPGEPRCPPLGTKRSPASKVPAGGTCWRPPEEQGIVFIVLPHDDPGFPAFPFPPAQTR